MEPMETARRTTALLCAAALAVSCAPAPSALASDSPKGTATGTVFVEAEPGDVYDGYIAVPAESKDEGALEAAASDVDGAEYDEATNLLAADDLEAAEALAGEVDVERVEPNYRLEAFGWSSKPDDKRYSDQWALAMVNAQGAWARGAYGQGESGEGALVAVIDTGLAGTGADDNKRPDIDYGQVTAGVNVLAVESEERALTGDDNGHGTAVASAILSSQNNSKSIAGAAPGARVMPIKAVYADGSAWTMDIVCGIEAACAAGADVINISVGGPDDSLALKRACSRAAVNGAIVVAAAGNEGIGEVDYPAAYDSVVGVSSVDERGRLSDFSSHGTGVDCAAPGEDVLLAEAATGYGGPSALEYWDGTSFSAPYVAALAAIAKSIDPDMGVRGFKDLLSATSQDRGAAGFDAKYGWGVVDYGAAAEELLQAGGEQLPAAEASTFELTAPKVDLAWSKPSGKVRVSWTWSPGATGYKVYAAKKKGGTYKLVKTVGRKTLETSVKLPSRRYKWVKVRAFNDETPVKAASPRSKASRIS